MEFKFFRKSFRNWVASDRIRFFCIIVLALGIFFRFANLDAKVFWGDETYSASRIAGYSKEEIIENIYTGTPIAVSEVQKYQYVNSEKGLWDTLKVIASEAPHHPPLYYVLARFWQQLFGSSIAIQRSLSALLGTIGFLGIYGLCRELFSSPRVGWIAIALFAVSPIHILYAQEVREYSLWTTAIVFTGAALLRATRRKTFASWAWYAISLTLSLYAHLFSGTIAVGHFFYILAVFGWRKGKVFLAYFLASISALLFFSPWLIVFVQNESRASKGWAWVIKELPTLQMLQIWLDNLLAAFFDVPLDYKDLVSTYPTLALLKSFLGLLAFLLVVWAFIFLIRNTSKRTWLFIVSSILLNTLPLVLPDLISGGLRSTIARYQLPSYVGIQLAVAYLLASKLEMSRRQVFWKSLTAIAISLGICSGIYLTVTDTWWTKYSDYFVTQLVTSLEGAENITIVSDANHNRILSLSHHLKPDVRLQLVKRPRKVAELPIELVPEVWGSERDMFFFEVSPPPSLLKPALEKHKNCKFDILYQAEMNFKRRQTLLWKMTRAEGS